MARVYNFSAGPSMLPESVLKTAAAEMLDYKGTGESVMEMSHRSKEYGEIITAAESLLHSRQLQGPVPAGRRFYPVCRYPAQLHERHR